MSESYCRCKGTAPRISRPSIEKGWFQFCIHDGNPVTEHLECSNVCAVLFSVILAAEPLAADLSCCLWINILIKWPSWTVWCMAPCNEFGRCHLDLFIIAVSLSRYDLENLLHLSQHPSSCRKRESICLVRLWNLLECLILCWCGFFSKYSQFQCADFSTCIQSYQTLMALDGSEKLLFVFQPTRTSSESIYSRPGSSIPGSPGHTIYVSIPFWWISCWALAWTWNTPCWNKSFYADAIAFILVVKLLKFSLPRNSYYYRISRAGQSFFRPSKHLADLLKSLDDVKRDRRQISWLC